MPAYRTIAPHRHDGRPDRCAAGTCRICKEPITGQTRRGRVRRLHDGRALADGTIEPNCSRLPGSCAVCAAPVAIGKRGRPRFWHDGRKAADGAREPNCLAEHKMRFNPNYAKGKIAKRDGARCAQCHATKGRAYKWLHLDHVLPLKPVDPHHAPGSKEPDNMQLLCPPCHTAKTSWENSTRAARRKEARAA